MSLFSSFSPSMLYLISKMVVFLALAGLIGLFIGWAIGKIGQQNGARRVEREWRRTIADTEEEHSRVIARFKKSNQSLDDENNNLKTKISALNAKIDQNRDDVERNKTHHRHLNSEVDQTRSEMNMLQNELAEERAKNHKLQNLTKALKSSSDEKDRVAQQLSMQLQDNEYEMQSLQSVEANADYMALQREVSELRSADRENADLRKRISIESREREDAQAELYNMRQQLDNIEREREDYRQWSVRLEQEQAGFDQKVKQAVNQAVSKEGSNSNDLELEVARLRPMVVKLQAEVDALEDENRRVVTEQKTHSVGAAGPGSSAHISELQSAVDKLSYERDQLRTRLADQQRQTAALNNQITSGVNPPDVASLRREIAALSAEKGVMSAQIDEMQERLGI